MDFYLNCWVPSLSGFYKVRELKNCQLLALSKYILNEDHPGTSDCFEKIINENVVDNDLQLTRFDKWFVLCFLRAANISHIINLQTTNKENIPCNIELSLFDILSRLSESISIPVLNINLEKFNFELTPANYLYSKDNILNATSKIIFNKTNTINLKEAELIYRKFTNINLYISQKVLAYDSGSSHFIINNTNPSLNLKSLPVRLFDNSLYFFVRSIYHPYCKDLYQKFFYLMKYNGFSFNEVSNLTPIESEIFLNLYKQDENNKTQSESINIQ